MTWIELIDKHPKGASEAGMLVFFLLLIAIFAWSDR